jgi:hypothetical protein
MSEEPDLGFEFLGEVSRAYQRILEGPLKHQALRTEIRQALIKHFSHAVYFSLEDEVIVVLVAVHRGRR